VWFGGEIYSLKNSEKNELILKCDYNANKLELIEEISKKAPKSLGFSVNTSPDRFWLLDVLNTLDPTNA